MRIDQSTKLAATTFLRALARSSRSTDQLLELFYDVENVKVEKLQPEHYSAEMIVDTDTGEELCSVGREIGDAIEDDPGVRASRRSTSSPTPPTR